MTNVLACLIFPLMSGCDAYIDRLPSSSDTRPAIAQLLSEPERYDAKSIVVEGSIRELNQFRTTTGLAVESFLVCDSHCVHVFMGEQNDVYNGERVAVRGKFTKQYRTGGHLYRNEIEAEQIFPNP